MQCPHSTDYFVSRNGSITRVKALAREPLQVLTVPCGQCVACKCNRGREWHVRGWMEAVTIGFSECCFITLTVAPELYETVRTTRELHPYATSFWKSVRHELDRDRRARGLPPQRVRLMQTFEYGEKDWRVHQHACVFGHTFDRERWFSDGVSESDKEVFLSDALSRHWPHGRAVVQPLTHENIAYSCRHMVKKVNGDLAEEHYTRAFVDTGEVVRLTPEFQTRSLGIGRDFYGRFKSDIYPCDTVRIGDKMFPVPKYFDRKLRLEGRDGFIASTVDELRSDREDVDALAPIRKRREEHALAPHQVWNNSPERLAVREESLRLRVERRKREGF